MLIIISVLLSLLSVNSNAEYVTPYGAKVLSLADGGRAFLKGVDAVMVNPAGAYFLDDAELGIGANFGYSYGSVSALYAGDNGFQAGYAIKDIDKARSIASMQTYIGYSLEISKWWIMGANVGYNFVSAHPGLDMNAGISFGPGLPTANRSGIIGAITVRNPFEKGGIEEVSASIGYSYRGAFNLSIDNIYVPTDSLRPSNIVSDNVDAYDIVFAIETFPLEDDDFTMTFSARINGVGDYNQVQIGLGLGYIFGRTSRFNMGAYATDFKDNKLERVSFGFSFVQGV